MDFAPSHCRPVTRADDEAAIALLAASRSTTSTSDPTVKSPNNQTRQLFFDTAVSVDACERARAARGGETS